MIAREIHANLEKSAISYLDGLEVPGIINALNTQNLFVKHQIVVCDGFEKGKKGDMAPLVSYLLKPAPFSYLILGSSGSKAFDEFYPKVKKELILLDLSQEKPWDRQKRILQYLQKKAQDSGKKLLPESASLLWNHFSNDAKQMENELEKAITFIGEKKEIDTYTIQTLSLLDPVMTSWQAAEKIVWTDTIPDLVVEEEPHYFLGFLGQIRYQLQIGLQISCFLEEQAASQDLYASFPSIKESTLSKFIESAYRYQKEYFIEGLRTIFEIERMMKSSLADPCLLWDILCAKLSSIKKLGPDEKRWFAAASQSNRRNSGS